MGEMHRARHGEGCAEHTEISLRATTLQQLMGSAQNLSKSAHSKIKKIYF